MSLLAHSTVLFTPKTTIRLAGKYPLEEVFEPAPSAIVTRTSLPTDFVEETVVVVVVVATLVPVVVELTEVTVRVDAGPVALDEVIVAGGA